MATLGKETKDRVKKISVGVLAVFGASFAPIIPDETTLLYSYQVPTAALQAETERITALPTTSATSSAIYSKPSLPPQFTDHDRNGIISVSVFMDSNGDEVFVRIPDAQYLKMLGKTEDGDGVLANPKHSEFRSAADTILRPAKASAAVARDTFVAITGGGSGATSVTYSHTVSGSNTYLLVYVGDQSGDTVSSCTYNSVSMTQLIKETRSPDEGSLEIYAYGLSAPSSGANNVSCSRSGTIGQLFAGSISYTGVNQVTSPVDATASSNGAGAAGTSITTSITTVADSTAVSGFAIMDNGSVSAGTGWTSLSSNSSGFIMNESTSFPLTPAGLYSYTTNGANSARGQVVVSLAPVSAVDSSYILIFD